MTDWSRKIQRTNDEIASLARRLKVDPDFRMAFLCECDPACGGFARLSCNEFDSRRQRREPICHEGHVARGRGEGGPAGVRRAQSLRV